MTSAPRLEVAAIDKIKEMSISEEDIKATIEDIKLDRSRALANALPKLV